jgi:type II secretory pathway pseudopilin PulG
MASLRRGEDGYNFVILIMIITVMNIFIAAMLPLWSTAIRREKEEELIFRGWQYAEAIRVFHIRYQRYPNKLEELVEMKPRCIRQLWKDPMTDDGKWGIIFQGQGQPLQAQPGGQPGGIGPSGLSNNPNNPNGGNPDEGENQGREGPIDGGGDDTDGIKKPGKGDTVAVGPIVGVYSKSPKKSILVFYDHKRYDEWRFTEDLLLAGQRRPGQPGIPGMVTDLSTRWLGRPMQFMNQDPGMTPQDGTMPDGRRPGINPGGRPGTPGARRPGTTSPKPNEG